MVVDPVSAVAVLMVQGCRRWVPWSIGISPGRILISTPEGIRVNPGCAQGYRAPRRPAVGPHGDVLGIGDAPRPALPAAGPTLRDQWPDGRLDWAPAAEPDSQQRRLLRDYTAAFDQPWMFTAFGLPASL
jgi:hypothetical protein